MSHETQTRKETMSTPPSPAVELSFQRQAVPVLPQGFKPLGFELVPQGIDPGEIPQTRAELGELLVYTYDLTARRAGELNIPVVGSISGGYDRRVVVLEWTRYKAIFDDDGVEHRYGYVIRFCLTVSKWEAQSQISLPFLTAQAELGNIQASWMMQIRGLAGPKIDAAVLPPQELDVETFVIAKQSLEAVISAADEVSTVFTPGILLAKIDPTSPESELWLSAVKTYSTYSVSRGRSRARVESKLGTTDPAANDVISEVYSFFGIDDPTMEPNSQIRQEARRVLNGISADA